MVEGACAHQGCLGTPGLSLNLVNCYQIELNSREEIPLAFLLDTSLYFHDAVKSVFALLLCLFAICGRGK